MVTGEMVSSEIVEKQCWIGVVVALLLILLGGTILVYRTGVSVEMAQGQAAQPVGE